VWNRQPSEAVLVDPGTRTIRAGDDIAVAVTAGQRS
jgi:hypothetical protein